MAIFTLLPAGWLSHLANLARPASELGGPDNLMAWYPLSDILLHLCSLVALAVVVLGIMIGYGPDLVSQMVDALLQSVQGGENPAMAPDAASVAQLKRMMLTMLPVVQGGTLEELLTGRPYDALDADPRWGRVLASRGADQRLVLTVTDGLVVALADAGADALTAVAGPWSRTEEFWGAADPGHLGAVLDQLAELAREARRCGAGVYCWVCV
ncbi:MAG: hypothetical protein IE926_19105 [Micrococcales bacterium]|nr:hypothetical protein [Micrococcales bacterium]